MINQLCNNYYQLFFEENKTEENDRKVINKRANKQTNNQLNEK